MGYIVKVIEYKGQLCVPIPDPLIKKLRWKEGNKVNVKYDEKFDAIVVKKI